MLLVLALVFVGIFAIFKSFDTWEYAQAIRRVSLLASLACCVATAPKKTLIGIVAFFALVTVLEVIERVQYTRDSRKLGCESPKMLSYRPFGIPLLRRMRELTAENRQLDFYLDIFRDSGRKTVRFLTANTLVVLTFEPDNVKTILATNFKDYSLGIRYEQFYPLLGNGIFTLSGDGWKHSRTLLRPQFARSQVSQLDSIHRHVSTLIELCKNQSQNHRFFDIQDLFHRLTIDTATEFLFGDSVDSLRNSTALMQGPKMAVSCAQFATAFSLCLDMLARRSQLGPMYWMADSFDFRRNVKICHNFVEHFVYRALERAARMQSEAELSEKRANESIDDANKKYVFIDELALTTNDPNVIRDQAFNILLAGRDTTASLLSFVVYHLARNKRVWAKLRNEIITAFGPTFDITSTTSTMSFEELKRCQYLNYVINETLRLHPSVPVNVRGAIRDTVLPTGGGLDGTKPVLIKKGMRVVYSPHVMHRLEEYWGANVLEFYPERWEGKGSLHGWEYLPFNGGPRICLGQQYALTEACYTIVALVQVFSDIGFDGTDPNCTDVRQKTQLTTCVANGVFVNCV